MYKSLFQLEVYLQSIFSIEVSHSRCFSGSRLNSLHFLKVPGLFLVHTHSESSTKQRDSSISMISDQPYMQAVFWGIAPVLKALTINMFWMNGSHQSQE